MAAAALSSNPTTECTVNLSNHATQPLTPTIVDRYRLGYPRYSALLSSHNSFQVYRRFSSIRTRMILQKQHEISALEEELDASDNAEKNPLYLSSIKRDSNATRHAIFAKLKIAINDYGAQFNKDGCNSNKVNL
jgi:hypothetical protein